MSSPTRAWCGRWLLRPTIDLSAKGGMLRQSFQRPKRAAPGVLRNIMRCIHLFFISICLGLFARASVSAADRFELVDGDRVVFLGNTLIEREQRYGYWETLLTIRYPHRHIQFRNLGWSGDTVFGDARAGFGWAADGFRHLKDHVLALKPTVIFIGYGLNESFEGQAGVPRFR